MSWLLDFSFKYLSQEMKLDPHQVNSLKSSLLTVDYEMKGMFDSKKEGYSAVASLMRTKKTVSEGSTFKDKVAPESSRLVELEFCLLFAKAIIGTANIFKETDTKEYLTLIAAIFNLVLKGMHDAAVWAADSTLIGISNMEASDKTVTLEGIKQFEIKILNQYCDFQLLQGDTDTQKTAKIILDTDFPKKNIPEYILKQLNSIKSPECSHLSESIDSYAEDTRKLDKAIRLQPNADVRKKAEVVRKEIESAYKKTGENEREVITTLKLTTEILENPNQRNLVRYKHKAKMLQRKPSLLYKGLGIAMMVLGGIITTVATLAAVVTAVPTFGLSIPACAGIAAGGGALFLAGLGLFAKSRYSGVSKPRLQLTKNNKKGPQKTLLEEESPGADVSTPQSTTELLF